MNRILKVIQPDLVVAVFAIWFLAFSVQAKVTQDDPQKMIMELSEIVLEQINTRAEELATNPAEIKKFADQYVLPYVDTERMARYIVGRYWREATAEQQQEFIKQFTLTIMRSYSSGLLKLNIAKIEVDKALPDGDNRVIVPTRVFQVTGSKSEVTYRVFQEKQTGNWLVYDIVVEGISLLVNFRKTYADDIERLGLAGVIKTMQERNENFQ